jgi:hypothetical protein
MGKERNFYRRSFGQQECYECSSLKAAIVGVYGSYFGAVISWEVRLWAWE